LGAFKARTFRAKSHIPKSAPAVERFQKTMLGFRKKLYETIENLQVDLDLWMREFNEARAHQGKWCFGKTPIQTFLDDALPLAREKSPR
jgi:hypothetical protein